MDTEISDDQRRAAYIAYGRLELLQSRVLWARAISGIGAIVCSFWLIYRVLVAHGFLAALAAFVGLSLAYKFGQPFMFMIASSFLCFACKAVGIWLPIVSYVVGAILLYVDVKVDNFQRRTRTLPKTGEEI